MFWYGNDVSGWAWAGMSLGMVAFWALLITALVLLLRSGNQPERPGGSSPAPPAPRSMSVPEQLLAERYARGEIDEDEYRRRLEVLHTDGPSLTKQ